MKIIEYIKHPSKIILKLDNLKIIKLNDKKYLEIMFKLRMGKKLDLNNPKSYSEKLQWLKLHDRKPIYTSMVDKYEAKKYVENIIGKEYIIPTIGIYDNWEEIDFDKLPNQFVIKCTHDSGGIVICEDKTKLDFIQARKKIEKSLKRNYYRQNREWPYKDVKPRIIIEELIIDKKYKELRDYKFFCFSGKCKLMFIATDRQARSETCFDFFDEKFNHLPFTNGHPNAKKLPDKPQNFDLMIKLAEKISKDQPQLRIDFYEVDGKVYFGEITFFHWSGMMPFVPEEWDYKFGDLININIKKDDE